MENLKANLPYSMGQEWHALRDYEGPIPVEIVPLLVQAYFVLQKTDMGLEYLNHFHETRDFPQLDEETNIVPPNTDRANPPACIINTKSPVSPLALFTDPRLFQHYFEDRGSFAPM
eukprot:TRINITY_DN67026_c0_g2_i1.p2 TRINITY_DN67026_c0_g2~~TRINITY_DN67026_c0_g2_i1.p2  ORF type:complete len:116 (-),score=5.44 TRINITY_DN67026_c0_g2_i1:13-360(-)